MEVLKFGSRGDSVKVLQLKLNLITDGIFGKITEEAVKTFLKLNGLTVDGIVGAKTWKMLGVVNTNPRKINELILHCTATPEGKDYTVSDIRKWHLARGFVDVGYHYIIYRDGSIHVGRDESKVGAHCSGRNSYSIGISYIGGVEKDGKTPKDTRTAELKISIFKLVKELMFKYNLTLNNVYPHSTFAAKACPSFSIDTFKKEYNKWNNQ